MERTVYGLFVGIDAYPAPVSPLHGCINDAARMHDLLSARITGAGDRFAPLLLLDQQATRQGLVDAFRGHLGQAGPGDVALFYYSGHGSQEKAPPEFWDFETDRLNETLVCYDSRTPGGWDLADKELAQLIAEVAANGPHFAVILDCCHSGSGTRDAEDITVRQERPHPGIRPISSYLVTPQQGAAGPGMPWPAIASGRHILLAACRPEQTAKETWFPGPSGYEKRGAFSFYLQDTLQQGGAALSYRDLFGRVNALVQGHGRVTDQNPQLEASEPADLDLPFLGGVIPLAPAAFTLRADKKLGWSVDAGAVHGIPQPAAGSETTQLALFPFDKHAAGLRSLGQAIGQAEVTYVYPGQSRVAPVRFDGAALDDKTTYRAVVTRIPLPPLGVAFEGDEAALELVRQAVAGINGPGKPSLLVREGALAGAEYRLLADAEANRYRIRRAGEAQRFAVDTPTLDPGGAALVAQRLEHIARWVSTARLANPATELAHDAVRLEVYRVGDDNQREAAPLDASSGLRYGYRQEANGWRKPRVQIRLHNTTSQDLFCMLLVLTEDYSIYPGLLYKGGVWVAAGGEAWAEERAEGKINKTIPVHIPDRLWRQGVTETHDTLKLIVSTVEADATLLQQDKLPVEFAPSFRKMPAQLSTLDRLMARVHTRDYGAGAGSDEGYADWTTVEVASTVVRPAEAVDVL